MAAPPVPPRRVTVRATGIGLDYVKGIPQNATSAINAALRECEQHTAGIWRGGVAAAAACEVFFERGMYFYAGGIKVPKATSLVGEGTALVSLAFYEQDNGTTLYNPAAGGAPGCKAHKYGGQGPWDSFCHDGYIWSAEKEPWGVHGLTVYVTKFHNSVFHVSNNAGFRMSGVRVRCTFRSTCTTVVVLGKW